MFRDQTFEIEKPKYTVPARRVQVEIFPDRVLLWHKDNHWTYEYLAIQWPHKARLD